ncbi:ATP-binding protein [Roseateles noduli]|uniref:ATP-binding protein n=1 Tax=Roseateles noduli TaxID=2052484 RepID=UPI003D651F92
MQRLVFGRFELRPAERLLLADGLPLTLGARAFDVLVTLAAQRDRLVGKEELFRTVWAGHVVEDNNLAVQISTLRKLLGNGAITTVTGRGYQFTASAQEPLLDRQPGLRRGNVPAVMPALFGREADIEAVSSALERSSLVTLCGAGGIGKTSLASIVAQRLSGRFAGGAWIVELAATQDPALVPAVVAQTLGMQLPGQMGALAELVRATQNSEFLVVLDNCEHLLAGVAPLARALLRDAPRLRLLVTSQEPLHVEGEQLYRLSPLSVPSSGAEPSDALAHGAVQLFIERVCGRQPDFAPTADDLDAIVHICRELDGIALAIELAAARVPLLGLAGVRARLGERLRTLGGGIRAPMRRHQTLRAALDWSFQLLAPETQRVLRRLGIFHGGFCADTALSVVREAPGEDEDWLLEQLDILLDRSLLVMAQHSARPRYQMLETMREYAGEQMQALDEIGLIRQRHAHAMRAVFKQAVKERDSDRQLDEVANLRAALAHAIATPGEGAVALSLATDSSVVLATSGPVPEVLDNLLNVERFVTADTDLALAAQYWQWVGRVGKDGRLPGRRCVEVLARAEGMFEQLGRVRRVHACRRQLAEAHLTLDELDAAEQALTRARQVESEQSPAADVMRRLRLEGLLADARGQFEQALAFNREALDIAELYGYRRYCYNLLSDRAWIQLQTGQPEAAEEGLLELLRRIPPGPHDGLPRAEALAAILAARTAAGRLDKACAALPDVVRALRSCGLFFHRGDIFAWLAAAREQHQLAARVLGAVDEFHRRGDSRRDRLAARAREESLRLMGGAVPISDQHLWMLHGRHVEESLLASSLETALAGRGARV